MWATLVLATLYAWPAGAASGTPATRLDPAPPSSSAWRAALTTGSRWHREPPTLNAPFRIDDTDTSDEDTTDDGDGADALREVPAAVQPDLGHSFHGQSLSQSRVSTVAADGTSRRGPPAR